MLTGGGKNIGVSETEINCSFYFLEVKKEGKLKKCLDCVWQKNKKKVFVHLQMRSNGPYSPSVGVVV